MTEFYEGQSVYARMGDNDTGTGISWVHGVVRRQVTDELVEVDIHYPPGHWHFLLARPGELVKGDAG